MENVGNVLKVPRVLVTRADMRKAMDNTNCPDTGASITLGGKSLMKKMGLNNDNLMRDNTKVSAAERSTIKVWGFIPVKLRVVDSVGGVREANECLYFAEGILNTLVSLTALKNLGCVSKSFPYPDVESASSLTERDNEDYEEDPKEEESIPREDTPNRPTELPFPPLEENVPKLRAWLVEKLLQHVFSTFG